MINKTNPLVSICIPAYEMNGKGAEYLNDSLNAISKQTYKNIEVVVSDHSELNTLEEICKSWSNTINIQYIHNSYMRGSSSANVNNAIHKANGDVIKILFQDDCLLGEESLQKQLGLLLKYDNRWLVSACQCYRDEDDYTDYCPRYNDLIQFGRNTIGPPSVLMFWNIDTIYFDENLIWLMDVDYYKRLYDKYGLPIICEEVTIRNREHKDQVSNTLVTDEVQRKEALYIIRKYGIYE